MASGDSDVLDKNDEHCVTTIRVLAGDVVQKAKSGHPGMPIGMAPVAHVLWTRFLRANPKNSKWFNRDRFVLSNGHGCALQYMILHLCGYDVGMDDLKQFRQLNSKTPGHPENFMTDGIEVCTGPLGQGVAQAVGMAIASKYLAATYNKPDFPVIQHKIYAFCGDGCMMEGVASEASSLAGHLKLNNLILIYDDNTISIDGHTTLSFTENVAERYRAYGWETLTVEDGNNDLNGIFKAIQQAQTAERPVIISLKTIIGYGTSKQDTHGVHGAPLGPEVLANYKKSVGFNPEEHFRVDPEVYETYAKSFAQRGQEAEDQWNKLFDQYSEKYPEESATLKLIISGEFPENWKKDIPTYDENSPEIATRNLGAAVLNGIAPNLPHLVGGSADLTPSTKTTIKCSGDFQDATPTGRYFRFGVREFGMFTICNGISTYGLVPFSATFLNFITYGWGAVRLGALAHFRQIYIMTHDSIFLGEDGPTHQPVEVLPLMRCTPNLVTMRPADGNEVAGAWIHGVEYTKGPTVICLSRQKVKPLPNTSRDKVLLGAYVIDDGDAKDDLDVVLISTGSEVCITFDAAKLLREEGKKVRVVSAPSLELFDQQTLEYRKSVLVPGVPIISVEASSASGWHKYSHFQISVVGYGRSAPLKDVADWFGFTPTKIAQSVNAFLPKLPSPAPLVSTLYD